MKPTHYFQRYSSKENVVTNNALLLFSRLYGYSPIRYEKFINELLGEDSEIRIGISIHQQGGNKGGNSIPDGMIRQSSFRIMLETKLFNNYSAEQLKNHLSSFDNEEIQILLLLAPERPDEAFDKKIISDVNQFNKSNNKSIRYRSVSFEGVIKSLRGVLAEQDYEIQEILEDYAEFCASEKLLPVGKYTMRIVPCSQTLAINMKYNMYYAPASRSFRDFQYLGIYADKKVKALGRMLSIVKVHENGKHEGKGFKYDILKGVGPAHAIIQIGPMIKEAFELHQHDIKREPHTFFIVESFIQANFQKISAGGLFGQRYLDLRDYVDFPEVLNDPARLADHLTSKTWV